MPAAFLTRKDYDEMKHYGDVSKISGQQIEDDFISQDLERKRNAYQSQEKGICKDCEDRVGLPCLFMFGCDKLKQAKQALKDGSYE